MLRADAVRGLGSQIRLHELHDRPQNRKAGQAQLAAVFFKPTQQLVIEQCVEHDAGRFLDLGQDAIELLLSAHQRIDMFHRQDLGVLRSRRARNGRQCLAGRVGHEVKVEIAASALRHGSGRDNL